MLGDMLIFDNVLKLFYTLRMKASIVPPLRGCKRYATGVKEEKEEEDDDEEDDDETPSEMAEA